MEKKTMTGKGFQTMQADETSKSASEKYSSLLDAFKRNGLNFTSEQRSRIVEKIDSILTYEPRIGVLGKTGVGKSSLCNALFGSDVAKIDDVKACTREPQEILLSLGKKGLKLIDVPGAGESSERDAEYAELYRSLMPELDVVLWILRADERAYSTDQEFYENIVKPHLQEGKPFFIVLNQADAIQPLREWDMKNCEPGPSQKKNLREKKEVVSKFFNIPVLKIIEVSAVEKYNLTELVDVITHDLPKDKKLSFIKNVEKDFVSERSERRAKKGFIESIVETVEMVVRDVTEGVKTVVSDFCSWVGSWF